MKYLCAICSVLLLFVCSSALADLMAYYQMEDDTGGTTVADATGNGHIGNFAGSPAPTWSVGDSFDGGNCLDLTYVEPTPARIDCGDNSQLFTAFSGSAMTITAWVYPRSTDFANGGIIGHMKPEMSPHEGWFFFLNGYAQPGSFRMVLGGAYDGNWVDAGLANTDVPLNTWSHVAVTYDGATVRYYLNGQPDGISSNGPGITPVTTGNLFLGFEPGWDSQHSNMKMDEVSLWNEVLDAPAIAEIYNSISLLPTADLTINSNPIEANNVLPYANETQKQFPDYPLEITAKPTIDCDNDIRYSFDHWTADSNTQIADTSNPRTTVTILSDANAQITAHYTTEPLRSYDCIYWDLSEDMLVSIPAPFNPATAQNPVSVGTAIWRYHDGTNAFADPYVNPSAEANWELPELGRGWNRSHNSLCRFESDYVNDVSIDKTIYVTGDVGGHSPIGATWTWTGTEPEWFNIIYRGYNARNQAFATDEEKNRQTPLGLSIAGQLRDSAVITGGVNDYANIIFAEQILPGEEVELTIGGGDWVGLELTIYKAGGGDGILTINSEPNLVTSVGPFVNDTRNIPSFIDIQINAARYLDCGNTNDVYAFDHWETDGEAVIGDVDSSQTTVSVAADRLATITAVYVDDRTCGDECHPNIPGDVSTPPDCKVNMEDMAIMAADWLDIVTPINIIPPIAHWRFDEGQDSTAYDTAGGHNGMIEGAAWTAGQVGGALGFDGTNDYVEVSDYNGISGGDSRTCTAWIKTASSQLGQIVSWGSTVDGQKWMFRVESDGTLGVGVWGGYMKTSGMVNDGQWHHVAAVLSDTNPDVSQIQLYIDGVPETNPYVSNNRQIQTSTLESVLIGARLDTNGVSYTNHFDGFIDDVRIYTQTLSAGEIFQLYQQTQ